MNIMNVNNRNIDVNGTYEEILFKGTYLEIPKAEPGIFDLPWSSGFWGPSKAVPRDIKVTYSNNSTKIFKYAFYLTSFMPTFTLFNTPVVRDGYSETYYLDGVNMEGGRRLSNRTRIKQIVVSISMPLSELDNALDAHIVIPNLRDIVFSYLLTPTPP